MTTWNDKKTSTPANPPANQEALKWNNTTAITATRLYVHLIISPKIQKKLPKKNFFHTKSMKEDDILKKWIIIFFDHSRQAGSLFDLGEKLPWKTL